jgi:hypothetical protein
MRTVSSLLAEDHLNHRKFWRLPRTLRPFDVLARIPKSAQMRITRRRSETALLFT